MKKKLIEDQEVKDIERFCDFAKHLINEKNKLTFKKGDAVAYTYKGFDYIGKYHGSLINRKKKYHMIKFFYYGLSGPHIVDSLVPYNSKRLKRLNK
jgi:hypothetical protein